MIGNRCEMKRRVALLSVILWLSLHPCLETVPVFRGAVDTALAATDGTTLAIKPELSLRHPRRGHTLTRIGDRIWITRSRADTSHFGKWGQAGFKRFTHFPNVEVIDRSSGKVTSTAIDTKEPYYKFVAFTVSENATTIYLAAANRLAKLDTEKLTFEGVLDRITIR